LLGVLVFAAISLHFRRRFIVRCFGIGEDRICEKPAGGRRLSVGPSTSISSATALDPRRPPANNT